MHHVYFSYSGTAVEPVIGIMSACRTDVGSDGVMKGSNCSLEAVHHCPPWDIRGGRNRLPSTATLMAGHDIKRQTHTVTAVFVRSNQ